MKDPDRAAAWWFAVELIVSFVVVVTVVGWLSYALTTWALQAFGFGQ